MGNERDGAMWGRGWLGQLRGWSPQSGGIGTPAPHRRALGGVVADAERLYRPPTAAAPGEWKPTEQEIAEWGSAAILTVDAGAVAPTAAVGLVQATYPQPLPLVLTLVGERVVGGAATWTDATILFDVFSGVGRGIQQFSQPLDPPGAGPVAVASLGFQTTVSVGARSILIAARLVPKAGGAGVANAVKVSASVAFIL